ncbi:MAG: YggS family pyridoxal phosphate-dependent enzyme [Clostridia bacterium]|nr:YggS family pyridoxal phosphate-dependent enzyme [Clostridia bacterium]
MTDEFYNISENIKRIRENITKAALKSGRAADSVNLVAVTKTVDVARINHALSCGIKYIGENKVQEFLQKRDELNLGGVSAHLIGHLQTNKVSKIVGKVDMIESVDSVRLAEAISKKSIELGIKTNVLLQVNIGREESKSGILPEQLFEIADEISQFNGIMVRGLMAIPPANVDNLEKYKFFSNMAQLFIDIERKKMDNSNMGVLSMGMSGDYEIAVECGATLVRVGTGIFGRRNYNV